MASLEKKLLVIGFVWPEPGSSAAGKRILQLLDSFSEQGYSVTFASTARESEYSQNLQSREITCRSISVNDESFDRFILDLQPDIVLFDRFMTEEQFGWRVHTVCPNAVRILDTEDLHLLRKARGEALKDGSDQLQYYLVSDLAKREIASIYRCDLSLIISESEMSLLTDFFRVPSEILLYLPFMIDLPDQVNPDHLPGFEDRHGFMTIGNFRHEPNRDAVDYLRKEIWPGIRKQLPEAVMNVYGAYPTQQVMEWHKPADGFFVHGRAEQADEVMMQSRVCLAPIRFGAGLKGKLLEAMQNGTPSVTTSMGAEGIQGDLQWPGAIGDSAEEFIFEAVHLYRDKKNWEKAFKQCFYLISERFSQKKFRDKLFKTTNSIKKELDHHRRNNFTGAMLLHHSMASTQYMSRWIEEKNRGKDGVSS